MFAAAVTRCPFRAWSSICVALLFGVFALPAWSIPAPPDELWTNTCTQARLAETDGEGAAALTPGRYMSGKRPGHGWDFFWSSAPTPTCNATTGCSVSQAAAQDLFVAFYTFRASLIGGKTVWRPIWYGGIGQLTFDASGAKTGFHGMLHEFRQKTDHNGVPIGTSIAGTGNTFVGDWIPRGELHLAFRPDSVAGPDAVAVQWSLSSEALGTGQAGGTLHSDCLRNFRGLALSEDEQEPINGRSGAWGERRATGWLDMAYFYERFEQHVLLYFEKNGTSTSDGMPRWLHAMVPAGEESGVPATHACRMPNQAPIPTLAALPGQSWRHLCLMSVRGYNPYHEATTTNWSWDNSNLKSQIRLGWLSHTINKDGPLDRAQIDVTLDPPRSFIDVAPAELVFDPRGIESEGDAPLRDPTDIQQFSNLSRVFVNNEQDAAAITDRCTVGGTGTDSVAHCKLKLHWFTDANYPGASVFRARVVAGADAERYVLARNASRTASGGVRVEVGMPGDKYAIELWSDVNRRELLAKSSEFLVVGKARSASCTTFNAAMQPTAMTPYGTVTRPATSLEFHYTNATHTCVGSLRFQVLRKSPDGKWDVVAEAIRPRNGYSTDKFIVSDIAGLGDLSAEFKWRVAAYDSAGILGAPSELTFRFAAPDVPDATPVDLAPLPQDLVAPPGGSGGVDGGAATYTLPIRVAPGRNGMQPSLSLNYSSRAGNGIAGMGWSLSGMSSIHRCPRTLAQDDVSVPVQFTANDALCLDGQRLAYIANTGSGRGTVGAQYRTELETYTRVTQMGGTFASNTGTVWFKAETADNEIIEYGNGNNSQLVPAFATAPAANATLSWGISKRADRSGNAVHFIYDVIAANGEQTLREIQYSGALNDANNRKVAFTYEARPTDGAANDVSSSYVGGGLTMSTRRLARITSSAPGTTATFAYAIEYTTSATSGRSALRRVVPSANGVGLPPIDVTWQEGPLAVEKRRTVDPAAVVNASNAAAPQTTYSDQDWVVAAEALRVERYRALPDFDGDGTREGLYSAIGGKDFVVGFGTDRAIRSVEEVNLTSLEAAVLSAPANLDFDNDGRADLVSRTAFGAGGLATIAFWKGQGSTVPVDLDNFQVFTTNVRVDANNVHVLDLNADGRADFLVDASVGEEKCSRRLTGYLNDTTGAPRSPTFTTKVIGCINPGSGRTAKILRFDDFDGNGLPDIWYDELYNSTGAVTGRRVLLGTRGGDGLPQYTDDDIKARIDSYSDTLDKEIQTGSSARWIDINGDGLVDVAYASDDGNGRRWAVRINSGGRIGARILAGGDRAKGLVYNAIQYTHDSDGGNVGNARLRPARYASALSPADIDADGRTELLIPAQLALPVCVYHPIEKTGTGLPPPPRGPDQLQVDFRYEDFWWCPPEVDGSWPYDRYFGTVPARPLYWFNGLPELDFSAYRMDALRFVQTGPSNYDVRVVPTELVSRVNGGDIDDFFGDGLDDVHFSVGCPVARATTDRDGKPVVGPDPCEIPLLKNNGQPWPLASALGATTVEQNAAIQDLRYRIRTFTSRNRGVLVDGNERPVAPLLPDMVSRVSWALPGSSWASSPVDAVEWDYYPLAAPLPINAARTLPLYSIPSRTTNNGYVDNEHFYFTSSMPVVSAMRQSSGVGAALTDMIERVYAYNEAMYHNRGRGFRGFRSIVEWNRATTLYSGTLFEQKFPYAGAAICSAIGLQPYSLSCSRYGSVLSGTTVPAGAPNGARAALEETWRTWSAPVTCNGAAGTIDARVSCRHVRPSVTSAMTRDPTSGDITVSDESESVYDAFGNVGMVVHVSSDRAGVNVTLRTTSTITTSTFDTTPAREAEWWRNKLLSTRVTKHTQHGNGHALPAGVSNAPFRETTRLFDYDGAATRRPNCEALFETGSSGTTTTCAFTNAIGTAAPTNFVSRTRTTYDTTYGYPKSVQIDARELSGTTWVMSSPRTTQTQFEATGYFPSTVTNALGHVSAFAGYNNLTGTAGTATDANGLVATTTYNALGQPLVVTPPTTADGVAARPSDTTYQWCKNASNCGAAPEALYRVVARQDGAPTTISYHDRRDRVIRTERQGLYPGDWFASETEFSALGDRIREAGPNYGGGEFRGSIGLPLTLYSDFDVLRRPRRKEQIRTDLDPPAGYSGSVSQITTYAYAGNTTTIGVRAERLGVASPEPTLSMTRTIGADGALLATKDALGGVTRFWYDGAGNPVLINSVNDQRLAATYNHVGERIAVSDAARGTWSFIYNGFGELTRQQDARSLGSTYTFDALGRTKTRVFQDYDGSRYNEQRWMTDEWIYDVDASGAARKGALGTVKRTRTTNTGGAVSVDQTDTFVRRYTYDSLLRPVRDEIQFNRPGGTQVELMASTMAYDRKFGRLKSEVLPGVEPIYHLYSETGLPKETGDPSHFFSLAGGNGYYERIGSISPFGTPTATQLRGGALAPSDWTRLDDYDASTGLRTRTSVPGVLELTYRYDAYGNMREQRDASVTGRMRERYDFDELHRLKTSTRYVGSTTSSADSTDYRYDVAGNLLTKSDFSVPSGYAYTGNRLTSVSAKATATTPAATHTFKYDENGNVTDRRIGTPGKVLAYDIDNLPTAILDSSGPNVVATTGSTFRYAPDGGRYVQTIRRPGSQPRLIFYFDKRYEKEIGQDGTIERWYLPGGAMKVKSTAPSVPSGLYYSHGDHLNSSSALTNPNAATPGEQRSFDAFGRARAWNDWSTPNTAQLSTQPTASPKNRRGFTQHEQVDNTNLIHMNGRVYDSDVGRFFGVDPFIQFPANSQSLNPYTYILNNPLSATDPTGYAVGQDLESFCEQSSHLCDGGKPIITVYGGNGATTKTAEPNFYKDKQPDAPKEDSFLDGLWKRTTDDAYDTFNSLYVHVSDVLMPLMAMMIDPEAKQIHPVQMREYMRNFAPVPFKGSDSNVGQLGYDMGDVVVVASMLVAPERAPGRKPPALFTGERPPIGPVVNGQPRIEIFDVRVPGSRYPESGAHIDDAQNAGQPRIVTIERKGIDARRRQSTNALPPRANIDRDEYPGAMFLEGGAGASVRYVNPSDNRGAGACIGNQCRGLPDGAQVRIIVDWDEGK